MVPKIIRSQSPICRHDFWIPGKPCALEFLACEDWILPLWCESSRGSAGGDGCLRVQPVLRHPQRAKWCTPSPGLALDLIFSGAHNWNLEPDLDDTLGFLPHCHWWYPFVLDQIPSISCWDCDLQHLQPSRIPLVKPGTLLDWSSIPVFFVGSLSDNANTGLITPPPTEGREVPSDWFSWSPLNNKQLWTIKLWIWLTSIRS